MAEQLELKPEISRSHEVEYKREKLECPAQDAEIAEIQEALNQAKVAATYSQRLRLISAFTRRRGGLRHDKLRQQAWPILLGSPDTELAVRAKSVYSSQPPVREATDWRQLPKQKDEEQVRLDVDRAFTYYPTGQSETQLDRLKTDLLEVITATLRQHPTLGYFQGFHDIAQVLLLVLGKDRALSAVPRLALLRLRDFMLPDLKASEVHLDLLPSILAAADPVLAHHLSHSKPHFALAAVLTLFSHDVENYSEIARLFDFLLAEEAVMAVYLFAAVVLARRDELLELPTEDDLILSYEASKIPKPMDFEPAIQRCIVLFQTNPPRKVFRRVWWRISSYSVLKTTAHETLHSDHEAARLFDAQLSQWAWHKRQKYVLSSLWKHRMPVSGIGAAIMIGLLSYWLQRGSGSSVVSKMTGQVMELGKMLMQLVQR